MQLQKWLEIYEVTKLEFSKVTNIPLRQIYRYINKETVPNLEYSLRIKVYTEGKVMLEDWFNEDKDERRLTIKALRVRFDREPRLYKESL